MFQLLVSHLFKLFYEGLYCVGVNAACMLTLWRKKRAILKQLEYFDMITVLGQASKLNYVTSFADRLVLSNVRKLYKKDACFGFCYGQ